MPTINGTASEVVSYCTKAHDTAHDQSLFGSETKRDAAGMKAAEWSALADWAANIGPTTPSLTKRVRIGETIYTVTITK